MKSIVERCVDKMFLDRLSSFERCLSSLLRLLMALLRSLLRIHKASLLETLTSTFPYFHISIFLYFYFHDFLNHCKQIGVYPKYLIFTQPNVSNKDSLSIRKRLLFSAINKRNKELKHVSKEPSLSKNFSSTQFSTIDFYILTKSITSHNKKSLQKSL